MARFALLSASGIPAGVPVVVRDSSGKRARTYTDAEGVQQYNRAYYSDDAGVLSPKVYAPSGTYTVAWTGGSTSVTVSGAAGIPDGSAAGAGPSAGATPASIVVENGVPVLVWQS